MAIPGEKLEGKKLLNLDVKNFDKEILESVVPAVVDFYADWCGPCRLVSPIIESLSREYDGRVKFAKVNTDENQDLTARYNIMSIPTVLIFKNGEIKANVIGAGPASLYRQKIDAILKN